MNSPEAQAVRHALEYYAAAFGALALTPEVIERAAQAATPAPAEPHGWITMWPVPDGGHKPVYSPGKHKPRYGEELDALLTIYPVYREAATPAPEQGASGLNQFLALAEAAGVQTIHDLPGLIPALQATEAATPAPAPPGWKLVPVEPTQAMHHAGIKAMPSDPNAAHWWAGYPLGCWAAMLAAAPDAGQGKEASK